MRIGTSFVGALLGTCLCLYGCGSDAKLPAAVETGDAATRADAASGNPALSPLPSDASEACDLHTKFPGDSMCLKPPAEGTGIQVHVGPTSYDDEEALKPFLLDPGQEITQCYFIKTT